MQFVPIGGFPPIILNNPKIKNDVLESRGFTSTNIVSINNIMNSKKKEDLFIAFGSDDENDYNATGGDFFSDYLNKTPHTYQYIDYKKTY